MNLRKCLIIIGTAALAAVGLVTLQARAADAGGPQRPLRPHWLERAKEKLGLTDEQVQQIRTQLAGERDTLKGLVSDLHEARVNLRQAIQASGATESSVRVASAKVAGTLSHYHACPEPTYVLGFGA